MNTSLLLEPDEASYYMRIIGIMRWMVELGRVDIATEVSQLSSFMAMPLKGHLVNSLHVMSYLRIKHNSMLMLDPTYPDINYCDFRDREDLKAFYGDVEEALPLNAPKPRGKSVVIRMFVDSGDAGDKKDRRSRTGFMVCVNTALIQWYIKKQATIEGAVFGAEFVAMKTGVETLWGIR